MGMDGAWPHAECLRGSCRLDTINWQAPTHGQIRSVGHILSTPHYILLDILLVCLLLQRYANWLTSYIILPASVIHELGVGEVLIFS